MKQTKEILEHLQGLGRGKITPLEALHNFGCFRLASRINELRKEGYEIKTTMVEQNGKMFAEYSLKEGS
jgi:hypothetical protein